VVVAPYGSGADVQKYIFGLYARCTLVLGMRFHANVCSIAHDVPTIGLVNYRQIEKLYDELGLNERTVRVDQPEFGSVLAALIDDSFSRHAMWVKAYQARVSDLNQQIDVFHSKVNKWLKMHFVDALEKQE
jgi:polysaccharide pyruvyl transferase WcaK-like protein